MNNLRQKRILLIVPRFFGYEIEIKSELEQRGAVVDWLPDRPFDTPIMTALTKVRPDCLFPFVDRLYIRLLESFGAAHYDIVFVINGQTLSKRILSYLRANFPTAKYILYLWDSFSNRAHVRDNMSQFDRVLTFDPQDALKYQLPLRPLFYRRGFEVSTKTASLQYDISFVGTAHTDRFSIVDRLRKSLPDGTKSFWYLYLQAPWVLQLYRWMKPNMRHARIEDFHFVPLNKQEVQGIFSVSRSVLDIEHPDQIGLTMRTLETLGAGKKLITTNFSVRNYDFYSIDNICIIDRANPYIPEKFLETPFKPLSEHLRKRYSISGWIDELLEIDDNKKNTWYPYFGHKS